MRAHRPRNGQNEAKLRTQVAAQKLSGFLMATRNEQVDLTDSGATGLVWLLAAMLAVSIALPLAAGALLRYIG
jgi:hypothetical protein